MRREDQLQDKLAALEAEVAAVRASKEAAQQLPADAGGKQNRLDGNIKCVRLCVFHEVLRQVG